MEIIIEKRTKISIDGSEIKNILKFYIENYLNIKLENKKISIHEEISCDEEEGEGYIEFLEILINEKMDE